MKSLLKKIKYKYFSELLFVQSIKSNSKISDKSRVYDLCCLSNVIVDDYTYIGKNSCITNTKIGKFCSIGQNFMSGVGAHPTNGLSTSPIFYSAENLSNVMTLCKKTKFVELKPVNIGNDVFIGTNVIILGGVNIGDGAVIGACAVVTKDVPPYAVVGGVPAKVLKYRFSQIQITDLQKIKWWNFDIIKLQEVEKYFYDIEAFINKFK